MKYASYLSTDGHSRFGALSADGLRLSDLSTPGVGGLREAMAAWGMAGLAQRAGEADAFIPVESVRWRLPITDPGKLICVGLNYRTHVHEAAREAPNKYPSLFVRFADSLVGHEESVLLPRVSSQFDYEAELAVIIGRPVRHATAEEALASIAGYACFAENSVRDYQKHAAQVTPGKNFHASGAFGPWMTSADEVGDPGTLEIIGRLNGQEMQRDSTANLIFPIAQLLAYISEFTPLMPGDVIATGTPAGVGSARKPPVFMAAGDLFEVEIARVGLLRNRVRAEADALPQRFT